MASDPLLIPTVVAAAVVGAVCLVGFEAGRTAEIARSWADGCAWLARRRAGLVLRWALVRPMVLGLPGLVWRWLLAWVPPVPHGAHRRQGVTR